MKMKGHLKWLFIILFSFYVRPADSQAPFSRGVNLTGWFQVNSPGQIQFKRFTKKDFQNIKDLGCDVVRLPVNMHSMTAGAPQFTVDQLYFSFLDSAVTWCEDLNLFLILDNHSFDPNVNTSPDIGDILNKVWSQTASRYKGRSDYLIYEILNEPHGISTPVWGQIQQQVINSIRANDTKHLIIVGGSGYNSYTELANLPVYADTKLLYTFHFYDPFMFTHQGASWTDPSMEPLAGVPFPYDAARMPACPASLKGTWVESSLAGYPSEGNEAKVKALINLAINFRSARGVNIFCGEFGVYIPNSNQADRVYWYDLVREYFESNNIPWTIWDYKGTFGLFNKGSDEQFEHDLNTGLLQSLGLNIPEQTPFSIKPDSTGFNIYTDYIGEKIYDASYSSGPIDFYSPEGANNGIYCLYWKGFSQYNSLTFDFLPNRDLSRLVSEGYALDFMVSGNLPGIKFDMRFIDSKEEDPGDHPWRMGYVIDGNMAAWDKKWHHVHIPLTDFLESGSWDNNTWYDPQGKFDWKSVDRFEISTEYGVSPLRQLWFDNIYITNLDTAIVRDTGTLGLSEMSDEFISDLKVTPNPVKYSGIISYTLPSEAFISMSIFSVTGNKIATLVNEAQLPGLKTVQWTGESDEGTPVPPGVYICRFMVSDNSTSKRIRIKSILIIRI